MNAEELRSVQAPLKKKYREHPELALMTLRAEGGVTERLSCKISTGQALLEAGLHPATGGDGTLVCSGDMLLEALAACAGVTLRAVATSLGITISDARIFVEGDLDFRGTLGVSKEAPVGFKSIRLRINFGENVSADNRATLLKLTQRYCVVLQTLQHSPKISVE